MNWLFILADHAAAAATTTPPAPTDWVSILLSAGVAGAILVYLFVKFIPDMKAEHSKERTELRADNEKQETKQRGDFLGALEKSEERAERREAAQAEQLQAERESRERFVSESTAVGTAQAAAMLRMSDSMDRFGDKLENLPDRIRRATSQQKAPTPDELQAAREAKEAKA